MFVSAIAKYISQVFTLLLLYLHVRQWIITKPFCLLYSDHFKDVPCLFRNTFPQFWRIYFSIHPSVHPSIKYSVLCFSRWVNRDSSSLLDANRSANLDRRWIRVNERVAWRIAGMSTLVSVILCSIYSRSITKYFLWHKWKKETVKDNTKLGIDNHKGLLF